MRPRQINTSNVTKTVSVTEGRFGAKGDGETDDSAAFQAAIDYVESIGGGNIVIPSDGVYLIGTTVNISGKKNITISGNFGSVRLNDTPDDIQSGYIKPDAGVGRIFHVSEWDAAQPQKSVNVTFDGLTFSDNTNITEVDKRGTSIDSAIYIESSDLASINRCFFYYLKGSAIEIERNIQGSISHCAVRYCGDASKPAVWLNGGVSPAISQSMVISNCKIESNYAAYLSIVNAETISVTECGFEANDTDPSDPTSHVYISATGGGSGLRIENNSFNKNGNSAIESDMNLTQISGNSFSGDYDTSVSGQVVLLESTASRSIISENVFYCGPNQNGVGVRVESGQVVITGNYMQRLGGIRCTGPANVSINNNLIYNSDTTEEYYIYVSAARSEISDNIIDTLNNAGTTNITGTGGVVSTGSRTVISNNILYNVYRKAIDSQGAYNTVTANDCKTLGNADGIVTSAGAQRVISNNLLGVAGTAITLHNESVICRYNTGFITEQSGSATITSSNTSVTVTHRCDVTPDSLNIVQDGSAGSHSRTGVTNIGSTTFDITIDATHTSDINFYWEAKRRNQYS